MHMVLTLTVRRCRNRCRYGVRCQMRPPWVWLPRAMAISTAGLLWLVLGHLKIACGRQNESITYPVRKIAKVPLFGDKPYTHEKVKASFDRTGKDLLIAWSDHVKSRWSSGIEPATSRAPKVLHAHWLTAPQNPDDPQFPFLQQTSLLLPALQIHCQHSGVQISKHRMLRRTPLCFLQLQISRQEQSYTANICPKIGLAVKLGLAKKPHKSIVWNFVKSSSNGLSTIFLGRLVHCETPKWTRTFSNTRSFSIRSWSGFTPELKN